MADPIVRVMQRFPRDLSFGVGQLPPFNVPTSVEVPSLA
jgi:hypothetical protein